MNKNDEIMIENDENRVNQHGGLSAAERLEDGVQDDYAAMASTQPLLVTQPLQVTVQGCRLPKRKIQNAAATTTTTGNAASLFPRTTAASSLQGDTTLDRSNTGTRQGSITKSDDDSGKTKSPGNAKNDKENDASSSAVPSASVIHTTPTESDRHLSYSSDDDDDEMPAHFLSAATDLVCCCFVTGKTNGDAETKVGTVESTSPPAVASAVIQTATSSSTVSRNDDDKPVLHFPNTTGPARYGLSMDCKMLANFLEQGGDLQFVFYWMRGLMGSAVDADATFQDLCHYLEMPLHELLKANKNETSIGFNLWRDLFGAIIWKHFPALQPYFQESIIATNPGQMHPVLGDNFVFLHSDGGSGHASLVLHSEGITDDGKEDRQSEGVDSNDEGIVQSLMKRMAAVETELQYLRASRVSLVNGYLPPNTAAAVQDNHRSMTGGSIVHNQRDTAAETLPTSTRVPVLNGPPPPNTAAAGENSHPTTTGSNIVHNHNTNSTTGLLQPFDRQLTDILIGNEQLALHIHSLEIDIEHRELTEFANEKKIDEIVSMQKKSNQLFSEFLTLFRAITSPVERHAADCCTPNSTLGASPDRAPSAVLAIPDVFHLVGSFLGVRDTLQLACTCTTVNSAFYTKQDLIFSYSPRSAGEDEFFYDARRLVSLVLKHPVVSSFQIDGFDIFTDTCLQEVARHCPQLNHFSLEISGGVRDTGFAALAVHCRQLTHLKLELNCECFVYNRDCPPCLTSKGLETVALGCPQLTHLYLKIYYNMEYDGHLEQHSYGRGLDAVAKHCPRLTHLHLEDIDVPYKTMQIIAEHCWQCSAIICMVL